MFVEKKRGQEGSCPLFKSTNLYHFYFAPIEKSLFVYQSSKFKPKHESRLLIIFLLLYECQILRDLNK